MTNEIHQRIIQKNKSGKVKKQGFLVGYKHEDGTVKIGFSLCAPSDKYDKEFGLQLAKIRALDIKKRPFPPSIESEMISFVNRCSKVFKAEEIW